MHLFHQSHWIQKKIQTQKKKHCTCISVKPSALTIYSFHLLPTFFPPPSITKFIYFGITNLEAFT